MIRHGVQERIEIVRVAVASLNRGDWDAALELLAPDFLYQDQAEALEAAGLRDRRS